MEAITSRQNKVVREAAELLSSAGERRKRRQFLCEGARLCEDAARSGVEILRCFVTEGAREKYAHYLRPVLAASGESYRIADHVAGLLSSTKHPQGVFCQCRWPRSLQEPPARRETSCAVLEDLQDPGNLGTILRTAEALGVSQVCLLGECCDPLSPKALRASMGAVFRLSLWEEPQRERLCSQLRGGRIHSAGLCAGEGRLPRDRGGACPGEICGIYWK